MTPLTNSIVLAARAHDRQLDKGREPYILHALRVMAAMRSDEDRIAAVLHDVVEDTGLVFEDLSQFGIEIVKSIDALTRREGEDYFAYIERLSHDPRAVRVKLADLHDNMDMSRLPDPGPADVNRMVRYRKARAILQSVPGWL